MAKPRLLTRKLYEMVPRNVVVAFALHKQIHLAATKMNVMVFDLLHDILVAGMIALEIPIPDPDSEEADREEG